MENPSVVHQSPAPLRILVGFSGSVATIKARELVTALASRSIQVRAM
jgi:hypothetical protein